jgi:hypothetical protein
MSKLGDYQERQRNLPVPDSAAVHLESAVMSRLPSERSHKRRRPGGVMALVFCGAAMVMIAVFIFRPQPKPPAARAYVESVIYLDDHVCIWLEPVEKPANGGLSQ